MKKTSPRKILGGFTIVELLVVIAVIAILATVSIVAYGGIQSRAQLVAAQSDTNQMIKKLEIFKGKANAYPGSITDCPIPSSGNACLTPSAKNTIIYAAIAGTSNIVAGYELGILGSKQFMYTAKVQQTSANEYLRFTDLAPYIDKYGLVKYKLEFDIKSANVSSNSTMSVYLQNGSGSKYSFGATVPVSTSFEHQSVVVTPTLSNAGLTNAYLSFYGTYGTGDIPTVKDVTFQLQ